MERVDRTYINCTWAEPQLAAGAPMWFDRSHARWCCLALSDRAGRLVEIQPQRCPTCEFWRPRAELKPR